MKMWKIILPAAAFLLLAGQAAAQTDEEDERLRELEAREIEIEKKLHAAEKRMAEAAREIAEITKERLPRMVEIERRFEWSSKPRLGVTIESDDKDAPVKGVEILGVTPGSAASDAGLRPGDVMTSVNGETLSAESRKVSNMRLLEFLNGIEEGEVLKLEYLRDGKVGSVEVEPRVMEGNSWAWVSEGGPMKLKVPPAPSAPEAAEFYDFRFGAPWVGTGLGDLELVELNEGLGSYFGTDKGLLVVKAPETGAFELREGDVIQSIDGREPNDVRHALRILGSYQAGEKLELGIMRNKKKVKVGVEIPQDYQGNLAPESPLEIRPALAPIEPHVAPHLDEVAPAVIVDITS